MKKLAAFKLTTASVIVLVATGVIYHIHNNLSLQTEYVDENIGDGIPANWMPYAGERRKQVVRRTANPSPPFKTGVYDKFDTSKYTDSKGHIFIPSEQILRNMSLDELQEMYFRYVESMQVLCPRTRHIGHDVDGGYHVCEPLVPRSGCLAYSFGNRRDYSFDDGLAFHYGCEVHSFDPDDQQPDHQHAELVSFHKLGLGDENKINSNKWKLRTLDSIREMLGHSDRPLDILKIDIEGSEWPAMTQILKSKTLEQAHVKLFIMETHMHYTAKDVDAFMLALRTLQGIRDAGLRVYYVRIWGLFGLFTKYNRAFAHEIHFLKEPTK